MISYDSRLRKLPWCRADHIFITGRNEVVAKVIFLHLFVILFTGGGVVVVSNKALRQTPRTRHTTPPQTRHTTPPGPDTPPLWPGTPPPLDQTHHPPWTRYNTPPPPHQAHHPPDQAHLPRTRHTTPRTRHTTPPRPDIPPGSRPPREADSGIRSTSGRYASYWNAFLFSWTFKLESITHSNWCLFCSQTV